MSSFKKNITKLCIHCGSVNNLSKCNKCSLLEFTAKIPPVNGRIKNAYVISLKKDYLRLNTFFNNIKKMKVSTKYTTFHKFEGIDGSDYNNIQEVLKKFPEVNEDKIKGYYNKNPGSIGCYFSHLKLWQDLLKYGNDEFSLIMEDDAIFTLNGLTNIEIALSKVQNVNWDILYIGHNMLSGKKIGPLFLKPTVGENKRGFNSGLFGYIIRKSSLEKLINIIKRFDYQFIDVQLRAFFGEGNSRVSALFVVSNLIRHINGKSSRKTIDNNLS